MGMMGDWAKSKRMSQPVRGEAQVVAVSEQVDGRITKSACSMELVVSAEGLQPTPVSHRTIAPFNRWPTGGATLPCTVDLADPTRLKIHWDELETHRERSAKQAQQTAEAMQSGGGAATQGGAMDLGAAMQMAAAAAGQPAPASVPAPDSVAEQIEKLSALHASGALTAEEFADAKSKLLEDL